MEWTPDAVAALRVQRGETQTAFAKALGVDRTTISEWENGRSAVSVLNAAALDRLAGQASPVPPAVLIDAVHRTGANLAKLAEVRGMADAVLKMMRSVTEQQQHVVDSLAPWSTAEGLVDASRQLAANVPPEHHEQIRDSVRRNAAAVQQTPASPPAKRRVRGDK